MDLVLITIVDRPKNKRVARGIKIFSRCIAPLLWFASEAKQSEGEGW
jgi:hypothetical protein